MRECTKCGESKELTKFAYRKSRDTYEGACRACKNKGHLEWKNKPENKQRVKNQTRDCHLRINYGITLEEYTVMYTTQEGCCDICGVAERHAARARLVVDHDHDTGAVRALLCGGCNAGLGQFKENPKALLKAITYLKRFK